MGFFGGGSGAETAIWVGNKEITGTLTVDTGAIVQGSNLRVMDNGGIWPSSGASMELAYDPSASFKCGIVCYDRTNSADLPLMLSSLWLKHTIGGVDKWRSDTNGFGIGTTTPKSPLHVANAIPASADRGLVNIGAGAFDGSTTGFFVGSASGTAVAVNAPSGFAGDFVRTQIAGKTAFALAYNADNSKVVVNSEASGVVGMQLTYAGAEKGRFVFDNTLPGAVVRTTDAGTGIYLRPVNTTVFGLTVNTLSLTPAALAGGASALAITPGAHTAVIAEVKDFNLASHTMTITGAIATQRFSVFDIPTISAASALTATTAATVAIAGAPIAAGSAVITNARALWVQGGISQFDAPIRLGTLEINNTAGVLVLSATGASVAVGGPLFFSTSVDVSLRRLAAGAIVRPETIPANANYPAFGVGSGPFDGTTTGFFTGSSSGTAIGVNAASGFGGELIHLQVAGVSKFRVASGGTVVAAGTISGQQLVDTPIVHQAGTVIFTYGGNGLALSPQNGANNTVEKSIFAVGGNTDTITGAITTQRFNLFGASTITAASALTVTNAATLAIAGAPIAAGSAVITTPLALWIQAGASQFDGPININGAAATNGNNVPQVVKNGFNTASFYNSSSQERVRFNMHPGNDYLGFGVGINVAGFVGFCTSLGTTSDTTLRRNAAGSIIRNEAIPANANYPAFGLGDGPFDGTTTGFFVGSSSGTGFGINAATGFAGNLIHAQVAGVSKFKVDSAGVATFGLGTTVSPAIVGSSSGNIGIYFTGSAVGLASGGNTSTVLQVNAANNATSISASGGGLWDFYWRFSPSSPTGGTAERTAIRLDAYTNTITGGYTTERAVLFNPPTITAATAQTVTNAATLAIAGAPIAAGSAVITNALALWVQAGFSRFDGQVLASVGSISAPGYSFVGQTGTGIFLGGSSGGVHITSNGVVVAAFGANNASEYLRLPGTTGFGWCSGTNAQDTVADTRLKRQAAGSLIKYDTIPANANYPAFGVGSGPFDGTTTGFFTGNANGTGIGINAASGYTGDLINVQVAGVSAFKVNSVNGTTFAMPTGTNTGGAINVPGGLAPGSNFGGIANIAGGHLYITPVTSTQLIIGPGSGGQAPGDMTIQRPVTIATPVTSPALGSTLLTLTPYDFTAMTAEKPDVILSAHTNTITGGYTNQRFVLFNAPTITAASALTVANAATLAIAGAPAAAASAVITNPRALWVQSGISQLDGALYLNDGTFDASNYRRANIGWSGGDLSIGVQTAGTGSTGLGHILITAPSGKSLRLGSAGGLRWQLNPTGHFIPETDNTYDIGSTGALRPRDLFMVGRIFSQGAIPANANYGAISVGSGPFDGTTTGFFVGNAAGTAIGVNAASGYTGRFIDMQTAGVRKFAVNSDGTIVTPLYTLFQNSNTTVGAYLQGDLLVSSRIVLGTNAQEDVQLNRDASDILALRRGANAQTFRIYGTFTDASNYERLGFITAAGDYSITPQAAGTGTLRGLQVVASGGKLGFYGVTAIVRQVLATGAGHTVDDIITALQNLGLVSQT